MESHRSLANVAQL